MKRTYLVAVDLADNSPQGVAGTAELISETLLDNGINVLSVEPWSAPSEDPSTQGLGLGSIPGAPQGNPFPTTQIQTERPNFT